MPSIELGPTTPVGAVDLTGTRPSGGVATPASGAAPTSAATSAVATSMSMDAGEPPVDIDRVTMIRRAIETGTYPLIPARIADAMIAAGIILRTGAHDHA